MRGRKPFVLKEGVTVDWTKSNKEVGVALGVSALTALKLRKRLGVASNRRGRRNSVVVEKPASPTTETPPTV